MHLNESLQVAKQQFADDQKQTSFRIWKEREHLHYST